MAHHSPMSPAVVLAEVCPGSSALAALAFRSQTSLRLIGIELHVYVQSCSYSLRRPGKRRNIAIHAASFGANCPRVQCQKESKRSILGGSLSCNRRSNGRTSGTLYRLHRPEYGAGWCCTTSARLGSKWLQRDSDTLATKGHYRFQIANEITKR